MSVAPYWPQRSVRAKRNTTLSLTPFIVTMVHVSFTSGKANYEYTRVIWSWTWAPLTDQPSLTVATLLATMAPTRLVQRPFSALLRVHTRQQTFNNVQLATRFLSSFMADKGLTTGTSGVYNFLRRYVRNCDYISISEPRTRCLLETGNSTLRSALFTVTAIYNYRKHSSPGLISWLSIQWQLPRTGSGSNALYGEVSRHPCAPRLAWPTALCFLNRSTFTQGHGKCWLNVEVKFVT